MKRVFVPNVHMNSLKRSYSEKKWVEISFSLNPEISKSILNNKLPIVERASLLSSTLMEITNSTASKYHHELVEKERKHKDEIVEKERNHKDEIVEKERKHKDEIVEKIEEKERKLVEKIEEKERKHKDEIVQKIEEIHRKELELNKVKSEQKEVVGALLRARGKFNLRGAVEYCKIIIRKQLTSQSALDSMKEPFDKTLGRLRGDNSFMKILRKGCVDLLLREEDVFKCLGGIYHNLSKDHHGVDGEVAIFERDWAIGERVAFIALFRYCNIPFTYYDEEGLFCDPPF